MDTMDTGTADFVPGYVGRIPVRNLWLLMLYASDLFRHSDDARIGVEDLPEDIPDLIAEILAGLVERRLRRNLSFGYQTRDAVLGRVRGRIDLLQTERHQLFERGAVACRFEELTVDTPRNRFVRTALEAISGLVRGQPLAHRCRALAATLRSLGVTGAKPARTEASVDRFTRRDADEQKMVAAAKLALDLALPTETSGPLSLFRPEREIVWIRRLYERAVAGFYAVVLPQTGWRVESQKILNWRIEGKTAGIERILPSMQTDIVLEHAGTERRIVIDTKFNEILTPGWFRPESLRSGYVYQIYAYLRSQEVDGDPLSARASGLLMHPSVGEMVDETVVIQGHAIRFATVDLGAKPTAIRDRLLSLGLGPWFTPAGDGTGT